MGLYDFVKKGITVKEAKTKTRPRGAEFDAGGADGHSIKRLRSFNPSVDVYKEKEAAAQKVLSYRPRSVSDAKGLVDRLSGGEALMIDLEGSHEEDAQRILDFVMGAAYVLGGEVTRVREEIFLVTAHGMQIMVEE